MKWTPEMVPRVSGLERFHCMCISPLYLHTRMHTCLKWHSSFNYYLCKVLNRHVLHAAESAITTITTMMCQRSSRACLYVVIMCRKHQYNYMCPYPADQTDLLTMGNHHRYNSMILVSLPQRLLAATIIYHLFHRAQALLISASIVMKSCCIFSCCYCLFHRLVK